MSDIFVERIAAVRRRFVAGLGSRIEEIARALRQPEGEAWLETLAIAHRHAHGLCGIGSTLGYAETGKVARSIEQLLLGAVKAGRELNADEIPHLREKIELLRATADTEFGFVQ